MRNFQEFVDGIVSKWRTEKKAVFESAGLGMPANRTIGDIAEHYVARKIAKHLPRYSIYFPKGSQTPSDIYAIGRRNGYWHVMLIQVKCSTNRDSIYELTATEIKQFAVFAKFLKSEIMKSEILSRYWKSPIIVSTGYAGIYSNRMIKPARHSLIDARKYGIYRLNAAHLDTILTRIQVSLAHRLSQDS